MAYYSNRIVKTVFLELWFQEVRIHSGGGSRKTIFLNYSHEAEALKVQVLPPEIDFSTKATSLRPP